MFVISRLFRIWHEKLSERCLNGTTKRGSSKGRWNHKAQQGGYATCDAEGISQIGVGIHEIRGFWPSKEKKVVSLHGSLHSMDHFWSLINNSFFFLQCAWFLHSSYFAYLNVQDFENAMHEVRPSVSSSELGTYEEWNRQFGSLSM